MAGPPKIGTSARGVLSLESPEVRENLEYELTRRKRATMRMSGSSMKPAIEDGDLITIVPVRPNSSRAGDVVVFTTESGTLLVHRIVRLIKREGQVSAIARGDNSQSPDPPFPSVRILGQAVSVQKRSSKKVIALDRRRQVFDRVWEALCRLLFWRSRPT
ncbi:MAG: signal peptidase I [Acidobacteria bacterium]|nr:signal peptidase I [Acidobacteriota bacterium]